MIMNRLMILTVLISLAAAVDNDNELRLRGNLPDITATLVQGGGESQHDVDQKQHLKETTRTGKVKEEVEDRRLANDRTSAKYQRRRKKFDPFWPFCGNGDAGHLCIEADKKDLQKSDFPNTIDAEMFDYGYMELSHNNYGYCFMGSCNNDCTHEDWANFEELTDNEPCWRSKYGDDDCENSASGTYVQDEGTNSEIRFDLYLCYD